MYRLILQRDRFVRFFNVTARDYFLKVDPPTEVLTYPGAVARVHHIIGGILSDLTTSIRVERQDRVRVSITADRLDEIWTPFMTPEELTADRIMIEVERVVQSNRKWMMEGAFQVQFVHAALPAGEGYGKRTVSLETALKKRTCFIEIKNRDSMCCARAIVTARARVEQPPEYKSIRQGRMIQEALAQQLHLQAGMYI
jgi:hypothetical protein